MPRHPFAPARGEVHRLDVASAVLGDNLLGDPATRSVWVYVPEGGGEGLPLFVDLVGYTGSGAKHLAWGAYAETVPQRLDRLVDEGKMGPVVCAFPDCFTRLGGNQYIDSLAMGRWEVFLTEEMVPAVEERFGAGGRPERRAVFGKSSGGYGALVHGMRHADVWGAAACHSGDMAFELCYLPDMAGVLDALAAQLDGVEGFVRAFEESPKVRGSDFHVLMTLAMAATYDPDPEAPFGVRLPVDRHTCEVDETRWSAWLAHDPVRLLEKPEVQASLRSLRGLYVDCGARDQYRLHYGARRLARRLEALGIEHRYEEFDDTHSGIDYRMDVSLPFLHGVMDTGA